MIILIHEGKIRFENTSLTVKNKKTRDELFPHFELVNVMNKLFNDS